MASSSLTPAEEDKNLSGSDTPLASKALPLLVSMPDESSVEKSPGSSASLSVQSPTSTDLQPSQFVLPIRTPLPNKSFSSNTVIDIIDDSDITEPLPPEIASADLAIAPDFSFVETSSGPAARELKRRFDQQYGVGVNIRSPYAITAFVNQHGKQVFRVGHRGLTAPGATAAETEQRISESQSGAESLQAPSRSKRRSRMSMHTLLPPTMFKHAVTPPRPHTAASGPRKLRKTRSIPDMYGGTASYSSTDYTTQTTTLQITGRAHSQSVTAADMPRPPVEIHLHRGDIFGEVMDWSVPSSTTTSHASRSFTSSNDSPVSPRGSRKFPAFILYPFGAGVSFDSPSRKPLSFLPAPRLLREMQSFDSVLTARQTDGRSSSSPEAERISVVLSDGSTTESDAHRPPSAIRIRTSGSPAIDVPQIPDFSPSPETSLHTKYSTDVFDVLQTYRGLPQLDKLSPDSEEGPVIKMSLSADDTAAPRDDPRFVIWGEVQLEPDGDEMSVSQGSYTDVSIVTSARSSAISRKRSIKAIKGKASDISNVSQLPNTRKVLLAATIERWIAQLTSDLNYDELLDFFMTYRTYISAVDLCHLLICRFHWALGQSTSPHDESVRRIVRVRTFVAIRYWLLTFFVVDFTPNRELRLLVANWLNTLIRDPILEKHVDGLSIVRKLRKVAKDCKKANTRDTPAHKPRSIAPRQEAVKQEHVLGEKFAEATRKFQQNDEDSDVDLDFLPDDATIHDVPSALSDDPVDAQFAASGDSGISPSRPMSIPLSSLSILQQTNRAPGPGPESDTPFVPTSNVLPIHHSALSRVFVKTIGRLGRWKRVLNSRSAVRAPLGACTDVSAFDLELSVSRDLLTVNGGVEQYLKMIEPMHHLPPSVPASFPNSTPVVPSSATASDLEPPSPLPEDASVANHSPSEPYPSVQTEPVSREAVNDSPRPSLQAVEADNSQRATSWRSSSTDSFGVPLSAGATMFHADTPWGFDVVSIDDLDLSDTSSDAHVNIGDPAAPPGLKKPPRRLPLRREFEFIRRESVSTMSMISRDSVASVNSVASSTPSVVGFGGNIHQWQMNALVDSLSVDDEAGDVEAALRKLEGKINPQKTQERQLKVDGWVRSIQERMAAGDYGYEEPLYSDNDDDSSINTNHFDETKSSNGSGYNERDSKTNGEVTASPRNTQEILAKQGSVDFPRTPIASQTSRIATSPLTFTSPVQQSDSRPPLEDAVPIEILQSRLPATPKPVTFSAQDAPRIHRSFILNQNAGTLAEHFAMIDRELYLCMRFEELVADDWMSCEEVNVLDWAQYLKDRARWKIESCCADKTTALAAIRARFNLIANFVISEVVLTHPNDRPLVVAKFIRIAWKSYHISNFHTLVAIIAGIRNDWVQRAMGRSWSRVGMWEMRMFNDLKEYTTSNDNFKHIRDAIESIADSKPVDVSSHPASVISSSTDKGRTTSESKSSVPTACVPFIGVYLSQLHQFSKLPDLIDPTAPNETVGIDPVTGNFDTPAHPEVFSALTPLPPSMHLEPLINVHKQRKIAGVIKSLVAGQHLASRVQFQVEKKLFQRCLKLRGLDIGTLQRAFAMYDS